MSVIIYTPRTDAVLSIDSTPNAMRGTLYDSGGRQIISTGDPLPRSAVYGYCGTMLLGGPSAGTDALFMVRSPGRVVRLRQIRLSACQVSGVAAAQATVTVNRTMFATEEAVLNTNAILVPSTNFASAVPKTSPTPPSAVALIYNAAGLNTVSRRDAFTLGQLAIPQRAVSRGDISFEFTDDGPDNVVELFHLEGLVFSIGSGISNTAILYVDWDEAPV